MTSEASKALDYFTGDVIDFNLYVKRCITFCLTLFDDLVIKCLVREAPMIIKEGDREIVDCDWLCGEWTTATFIE